VSLFKRGRLWWTRVKPGPTMGGVRVSTETTDHKLGRQMEKFADLLRDRHQWDVARAIGMGQLTLPEAFDRWAKDPTFKALRQHLDRGETMYDLDDWEQWALGHAAPRTVDQYRKQIAWLGNPNIGQLTRRYFADQIAALGDVSSTTKRNYLTAWSSFCQYLVEQEQLEFNPCHALRWPSPAPARERWMPLEKSRALVEAIDPKWRVAVALAEGAGVEWAALARGTWEDILRPDGTLFHAHGTKKPWRDRIVKVDREFASEVAAWQWRGDGDPPPVVPGSYWQFTQAHREAVKAIGVEDYTLHDARHSYAVRHMQANTPIMEIATNLGHKDASLVLKVYGKYRPR
jgi:integrase